MTDERDGAGGGQGAGGAAAAATGAGKGGGDSLEEFLAAAQGFVSNVTAAQVEAAGRHADAVLLAAMSRVLVAQFDRVCDELRASYRASSGSARRDADAALAVQQGALMARVGEEAALAAIAAGPGGGFFGWLSQHLDLIKKIFDIIIQLTHGGVYPPWWARIRELIDEILREILGLLAGILGFNRREVAEEMSARAVGTMNELAALARLMAAQRPQPAKKDD